MSTKKKAAKRAPRKRIPSAKAERANNDFEHQYIQSLIRAYTKRSYGRWNTRTAFWAWFDQPFSRATDKFTVHNGELWAMDSDQQKYRWDARIEKWRPQAATMPKGKIVVPLELTPEAVHIIKRALEWWESNRPVRFDVRQHVLNSAINTKTVPEHQLAIAIGSYINKSYGFFTKVRA